MSVSRILLRLCNRLRQLFANHSGCRTLLGIWALLSGWLSRLSIQHQRRRRAGGETTRGVSGRDSKSEYASVRGGGDVIAASRQPASLAVPARSRSRSPSPHRHRGVMLEVGYADGDRRRRASQSTVHIPLEPLGPTRSNISLRRFRNSSASSINVSIRDEHRRGEDVPLEGPVLHSMETLAVPPAGHSRPHTPSLLIEDAASGHSIVVTQARDSEDAPEEGQFTLIFGGQPAGSSGRLDAADIGQRRSYDVHPDEDIPFYARQTQELPAAVAEVRSSPI
jgi:hypothetical protein